MMIAIAILLAVGLIFAACAVIAALIKRVPEAEEDATAHGYVDQDPDQAGATVIEFRRETP